ncbi:MAG: SPOR domain-containing protein [Bacteroidota bacterium]
MDQLYRTMTAHRFLTLWMAAAVVLGSCAPTERARKDDVVPSSEAARQGRSPLPTYESSFNPADYDESVEEVLSSHAARRQTIQEESGNDSLALEIEYLQGFRIQIFATASIDEANAMRTTASQIVGGDSLYVVFDPPVYKVRLGDFTTRMDASKRLSTLVDRGFPDAWVVNDRIIRRKLIRVKP